MSDSPLVTIVIPTYNHAHFLRDALRSVCAQSFTDWEAIVVNNFSEDDTVAVVESFKDSRIRLENFRNNGIIAASRNRGISLARGRYIAFLDSDDTWYPEKLARCLSYFDNGIGLVCHGLHWIGDQEKDVFCGPAKRATFNALLDKGNCITPSATLVLKDLVVSIGCFSEDPSMVTAEDYHFSIKLAQTGINMLFIREVLGEYRIHSGNQSGSVLRHLSAVLRVVDEFRPEEGMRSFLTRMRFRRRYCTAYYGAGRAMQRSGQSALSMPLLFQAVRYYPLYINSYFAIAIGLAGAIRRWGK